MHLLVRLIPFLMLAALTVVSGPAAAETAESVLDEDGAVASPGSNDQRSPRLKSGTTALMWSLLGTAVPVGTGTLYWNDESTGLGLRAAVAS